MQQVRSPPSARGYNWATLFLGDINTRTWPSRLGESQMRQQNMAVSFAGLRPKSDCSGKAQKQLYSKLQTHPLVREDAPKEQTRNCLKEISSREKNWSRVPDGRLTPRQTGRLTVGRKLTSTSVRSPTVRCFGNRKLRNDTDVLAWQFDCS
jgi:hypothetical protein